MSEEFEPDGFKISKQNRKNVEEAERNREIRNPSEFHLHARIRQERDKRRHDMERKAIKKRS